jgi:hypothetical protein
MVLCDWVVYFAYWMLGNRIDVIGGGDRNEVYTAAYCRYTVLIVLWRRKEYKERLKPDGEH